MTSDKQTMHLFSDISAIAFLEMSLYKIYILNVSSFQILTEFCKVSCSYLEKFYLLTSTIVNNSVQLDVSGDNGLHLLLKKTYNNI